MAEEAIIKKIEEALAFHNNVPQDVRDDFENSKSYMSESELKALYNKIIKIPYKPEHLSSLRRICTKFKKARKTVVGWYAAGAPIAYDDLKYCAEYYQLVNWLKNTDSSDIKRHSTIKKLKVKIEDYRNLLKLSEDEVSVLANKKYEHEDELLQLSNTLKALKKGKLTSFKVNLRNEDFKRLYIEWLRSVTLEINLENKHGAFYKFLYSKSIGFRNHKTFVFLRESTVGKIEQEIKKMNKIKAVKCP